MKTAIAIPYAVGQNEPCAPHPQLVLLTGDKKHDTLTIKQLFCEVAYETTHKQVKIMWTKGEYGDITASYNDEVYLYFTFVEPPVSTIEQFVTACARLSRDGIYTMVEYTIGDDLRNQLYELSAKINPHTPEPVRQVVNHLGQLHDVASMKNY